MPAIAQDLRIEKLGYSSRPWRLVTGEGNEIITHEPFDHPHLGMTVIATPFAANTKAELIDMALAKLSQVIADNANLRQELAILKENP